MRPPRARCLAAGPPPSTGHAGDTACPPPSLPAPRPGSPSAIGAQGGVQSPGGGLSSLLGLNCREMGSQHSWHQKMLHEGPQPGPSPTSR